MSRSVQDLSRGTSLERAGAAWAWRRRHKSRRQQTGDVKKYLSHKISSSTNSVLSTEFSESALSDFIMADHAVEDDFDGDIFIYRGGRAPLHITHAP